ncbi:DNA primase, partial [Streptomyces sp. NPDC059455]
RGGGRGGGARPGTHEMRAGGGGAAPDDTVRAMVTELAVEPPHTRRDPDEVYAGVQLVAVRLAAVNHRVTEVRGALQRLGQHADPAHLAAVQNELWVLQQYGQSLRDRGVAAL